MLKFIGHLGFPILLNIAVIIMPVYKGTWMVRAPELFGDGHMYIFNIGNRMIGYVDSGGDWIIYGRKENCRLIQISGEPILGIINGSVPCFMRTLKNGKFNGWIDFRGHIRKFCGVPGIDIRKLPSDCLGN